MYLCFFLDVDECVSFVFNDCNVNVLCINSEGLYICCCCRGYGGDGRNCIGI